MPTPVSAEHLFKIVALAGYGGACIDFDHDAPPQRSRPTRVRTFYPADPVGIVPGGVDTFIRGLIKWAPDDIVFSLVGMTTDPHTRPVGLWSHCDLGRRQFEFLPVVAVADAGSRTAVPLSLRYVLGALRHRDLCRKAFDVFDYHRVEPALLHLGDPRPRNAFFHNDMAVLRTERLADILWRRWPAAYFMLEARVMRVLSSAWSVREPATEALRQRYPFLAKRIHFTPTWVDPEVFQPRPDAERSRLRAAVEAEFGLDAGAFRLISVGRLDSQKDPLRLLEAVAALKRADRAVELLYVGDGVLRPELERRIAELGLGALVRLLGLRSAPAIADLLQATDCFVLASAYEGMPMALLEALGSGVPVVTTPVGEVARVVTNGRNGQIAADHSAAALAEGIAQVMDARAKYTVQRCLSAVEPYFPDKVLRPVYENYRRLDALQNRSSGRQ